MDTVISTQKAVALIRKYGSSKIIARKMLAFIRDIGPYYLNEQESIVYRDDGKYVLLEIVE